MKISDIMVEDASEKFDKQLLSKVLDTIVMYKTTGTLNTNINNILSEIQKYDLNPSRDDLQQIIINLGYEVDGDIVTLGDEEIDDEVPETEGEEGYDEVSQMAKNATEKRMK